MSYEVRMSSIVFLLLWTLCNCGTDNDGNVTAVPAISSKTPTGNGWDGQAQSQQYNELGNRTVSPKPAPFGITTARSKLWSPYSTLSTFMAENDEEAVKKTGSSSVEDDPDNNAHMPKIPIISSIRHFRSRKNFVRTRKPPPPNSNLQSELTVKSSHVDVQDLEREQGDQPYYNPISPTDPTAREYKSGTHPLNYGKVVASEGNSEGPNSGISSRSEGKAVYGTYFTRARPDDGNSSSKMQRINKTFLFQKRPKNNSSPGNTSDLGVVSQSSNKDPVFFSGSLPPVKSSSMNFTSDEGVNTNSNYYMDREKLVPDPLDSDSPLNPQRGKGGGKKSRGKGGTRKPKIQNQEKSRDGKSTGESGIRSPPTPKIGVERKQVGGGMDLQHGAFRKVKEKQRLGSHHPEIRGKSDYKPNYNSDALGDDNDHPSQLFRSPPSPQLQDQFQSHGTESTFQQEPSSLDNTGLEGKDQKLFKSSQDPEYFPKVETEEVAADTLSEPQLFSEEGTLYETIDSRTPFPYGDESESYVDASQSTPSSTGNRISDTDIVTVFLKIVESQHLLGENCSRTNHVNLGEGVVDRYAQERFRLEAELTVNRANMLTRFWKYADPKTLEDEYILHAMVTSLIEFDEDIFAAGNCYDENQYKNYTLFCPYGYRMNDGSILVKDLSLEYQYLTNSSEWFYNARKHAERVIRSHSQFSRGFHSFRTNESIMVDDEILNVTYDDGKWSKPYFDCGGANIWMITYTVPFFGYNGTYYFKGTSGIDVDLRRVDIDQCPLPENSTELNIFAASDKCKKSTTKCVPMKGLGFRRGSYRCECKEGFYFPNISSVAKYFNGTLLEEEYEKKFTGNDTSLYDGEGLYECLECPHGCDTCVDDRPCVVSLNWLMRSAILILQCAIIAMLPIVGLFTWKYSNVKVVRAASPVLLRFIVLGAFFIYCTILVMYPSPNVITCTLRVWLREIGFSLAYGALMLKTWRISVIFRVRSAKAIKITDMDLMKRLGIIVAVFTSLLVIRTLVAPPVAIVSLTADELKAWLCKSDWWDHSFTIMELSVLVWGIRLCIVVRKAPSEFNESKFISLAIYNEFLLSLFLNISMLFLQSPANPDLLYIIFFCHVQLTMTLLLCLIFGSKAYIVFRGQGKGLDESRNQTSKFISKSRSGAGQTTKQPSAHNSTGLHSSTTSTGPADPNVNSRLSEDVQEEFRRLYFQLEELKERNMRLGNRHLVAKIAAMQEAADNILCTSAQINGQHQIQYLGTSPNVKGKSGGVLSDISEEENPFQHQSNVQTLKPKEATGIDSGESEICRSSSIAPTKQDVSGSGGHRSACGSQMPTKAEGDGQLERDGDEGGERYLEKVDVTREKGFGDRRKDEVQFRKLQDTNLDEVELEEELEAGKVGVTFDLGENDIKPDCINDGGGGGESIPMKSLRKRKHKQSSSEQPKSESGLNSTGKKADKSQNHTGNSSSAAAGTGTSASKLVLDLDDKSRFTEEITV